MCKSWIIIAVCFCLLVPVAEAQIKKFPETWFVGPSLNYAQLKSNEAVLVDLSAIDKEEVFNRKGVTPIRNFGKGRYLIRLDSSVTGWPSEVLTYRVDDRWKWSERILDLKKHEKVSFLVQVISNDNTQLVNDYELEEVGPGVFAGRGDVHQMRALAAHDQVRYISLESLSIFDESRVIDMNLNPNAISKLHALMPNIQGQGMVVAVKERSFDTEDLDLMGRMIQSGLEDQEVSPHATEIATIIAGAGNTFVTGKGVAPRAFLSGSSYSNIFPDDQAVLDTVGARVQNHSYGTVVENEYGLNAQQYDQAVGANPTMVHVFSIGNSGYEVSTSGLYQGIAGYANLTGNFKTAKNVLTVGAVDSIGRAIGFSSRGPAFDGRVKPEVCAYSMVGSSNAAALVSGTVALLQQRYLERYHAFPGSDLIKALLIVGGDDLGDPGPDFERGFVQLDAYRSMLLLDHESFYQEEIANGQQHKVTLHVDSTIHQVTVGLVWVDPAANPGDTEALVNDLNLKAIAPDGEVLYPWVLATRPDMEALQQPAIRGVDHLNNVEMVSFQVTTPGEYQLVVSSKLMLTDRQEFSVVYRFDSLDTFEWEYPLLGSYFPYNGETGTYFRWSSTLQAHQGSLYYRYLDSAWTLVGKEVALADGYYRWDDAKWLEDGLVEAMMVVGSDSFATARFMISHEMNAQVAINCGDSLLLTWRGREGVRQYEVKQPGDQYLELLSVVEDTFLLLEHPPQEYLSIQPIGEEFAYLPTTTFNYTDQGAACFVSAFYHGAISEEGIYLNLELSSVYGVDSLMVTASSYSGQRVVYRTQEVATSMLILDDQPVQGYNEHELNLYLANGEEVRYQASGTFYLTEKAVLIFPNPVLPDKIANFYTRELDQPATLTIFSKSGAIVLETILYSSREAVSLHDLRAGLYVYKMDMAGERYQGKIIIH